jgi:hypothetical protein
MTDDQYLVLQALYQLEEARLLAAEYNLWTTPTDVANALPADHPNYGDLPWVRERLRDLWISRKVLQVTDEVETPQLMAPVELSGHEVHGVDETQLAVEATDCRRPPNPPPPPCEEVAVYVLIAI